LHAGDRIMPEVDARLAEYGDRTLRARRGTQVRTGAVVRAIERGRVHVANETIEAETIVLAAGVVPSPVLAALPVQQDRHGYSVVDAPMRCRSHPEVRARGDCASVPGPDGNPYPKLAQHALREAKVLARNLVAAMAGRPAEPFVYQTMGIMGSLGHSKAFG